MTAPRPTAGPDFAGVLAGHVAHIDYGRLVCTCTFVTASWESHREHVAAELRAVTLPTLADAWDEGWAARAQTKSGSYSLVHLDQPYRKAADALAAQVQP